MDLKQIFTPQAIAANWTEAASNKIPALGEAYFTPDKKAGLSLSYVKGNRGLPVSLMPSTFDAQATFRDRLPVEKIDLEMPFFREGFKIKEKDRQELLRIVDSNDPYAETIIANLYNDANELIDGANVVAERMRMQLLFPIGGDMGITIKANGVDYTYDYDIGDVWKSTNYFAQTSGNLWTNTSGADPFSSIETVQNAIRNATGTELKTMIMNSYTFNLLKNLDAVKARFLSTSGTAVGYVTKGDVMRIMSDTLGLNIAIYDKQYKNESGTAAKFVPDGYVCLVPDGPLGKTWYGTTPEEIDGKAANMEVAIVNTGVAVAQIWEPHPVNKNTIASEIVLPSFERASEVAVMKVIA